MKPRSNAMHWGFCIHGLTSLSFFTPFQLLSNGDLIIHDLSFEDMGMFKCIASNDNGEDMQETFVYPHAVSLEGELKGTEGKKVLVHATYIKPGWTDISRINSWFRTVEKVDKKTDYFFVE